MSQFKIINDDCLIAMQDIADGSVDMVLCDLPYGTMKNAGLDGWANQTTAWDVCIDQKELLEQYNRILRFNGALVLFSQEPFTSKLITEVHGNLPFSYRYTWLKDHFANALIAKKSPVNYTEDVCVFFKKYDTLVQHPLREYTKLIILYVGKSLKDINKDLGHRRSEHFFYVESTQFGICTEQTYNELIDKYNIDKMDTFMTYQEMKVIDSRFVRRFILAENSKFKSNVLQYKKDYEGFHPTQKPVKLLEDLIKTYTNEGETVMDNTMGSGSTGVAAINTSRRFIGIEQDKAYFEIANERINYAVSQMKEDVFSYG
jgi:site-specific DNA-methyltransferase (adenine-specific)